MGNLYPAMGPKNPWVWNNIDMAIIDYLTPEVAAAEVLPADAQLIAISDLPGHAAVKLVFAKYHGGTLAPYNEVVLGIPHMGNHIVGTLDRAGVRVVSFSLEKGGSCSRCRCRRTISRSSVTPTT